MNDDSPLQRLESFHRWFGWATLLFFMSMGLLLETLHGFKVSWYLDVGVENRRLLFTLAHSHGALIGLLHLALSAHAKAMTPGRALNVASWCLCSATILLPGGFFLGGLVLLGTDPGLGVFLTPVGGLLLVVAMAGALKASIR